MSHSRNNVEELNQWLAEATPFSLALNEGKLRAGREEFGRRLSDVFADDEIAKLNFVQNYKALNENEFNGREIQRVDNFIKEIQLKAQPLIDESHAKFNSTIEFLTANEHLATDNYLIKTRIEKTMNLHSVTKEQKTFLQEALKSFDKLDNAFENTSMLTTDDLLDHIKEKYNCYVDSSEGKYNFISNDTNKPVVINMTEPVNYLSSQLNSNESIPMAHAMAECSAVCNNLNKKLAHWSEKNPDIRKIHYPEDLLNSSTEIRANNIQNYSGVMQKACETFVPDSNMKLRVDILQDLNSCIKHYEDKGQKKYVAKLKSSINEIEKIENSDSHFTQKMSNVMNDLNRFDQKNRILGRLSTTENTLTAAVGKINNKINEHKIAASKVNEKRLNI